MTTDGVRRLSSRGIDFLELCLMDHSSAENVLKEIIPKETQARGIDKAMSFLQAVPSIAIEKIYVNQFAEKSTGNSIGICKIELSLSVHDTKRKGDSNGGINLVASLGCPSRRRLLANKSIYVNCEKNSSKKLVELQFDWKLALSGADDEGRIMLRVVREDLRGLDLERRLSLR